MFGILTALQLIARLASDFVLFLVPQIFPQDLLFRSFHESYLQTPKGKKTHCGTQNHLLYRPNSLYSPYEIHSVLSLFPINYVLKECLYQQLQSARPSGLF